MRQRPWHEATAWERNVGEGFTPSRVWSGKVAVARYTGGDKPRPYGFLPVCDAPTL